MAKEISNTAEPFYELVGGGRLSSAQIRMAMRLVARHLKARYGRVPARVFVGNHSDPSEEPQRFSVTGLEFYDALEDFDSENPVLLGENRDPIHGVTVHRQARAIMLTVDLFDSEGPDDVDE